jgi:hypothetical protein
LACFPPRERRERFAILQDVDPEQLAESLLGSARGRGELLDRLAGETQGFQGVLGETAFLFVGDSAALGRACVSARPGPAPQRSLFGDTVEKVENPDVAEAFRRRLQSVAGFKHVPLPMPMRNSRGAVVYYLFFASQKAVAKEIVEDIFARHRERG